MLAFIAAFSLHALLALQAPAATAAPATDQTILWFRAADAATIDARALLDAVAVYTRDLGLVVRAAADTAAVPADAPSASDAAAALRAQGARLGFWCELRPGAAIAVLTVIAPDGHLELHLVERTGAHEAELYRAIALKLRSVLVGTATPEPAPARAEAPPPPSPPAAAAAPDLGVRAQPAPPPAAPRLERLFATVGYRFSAPVGSGPLRHALAVDGALALGRWFEIDAGTELAPRLEQRAGNGTISLFDWPITIGARLVRRGARFSFGGGVFGAVHLGWATGTDDNPAQSASSFAAGGGAGAELLARLRLAGALAGELRVYGEVPVPTRHYFLRPGSAEALEIGPRAGIGLGFAFPAP